MPLVRLLLAPPDLATADFTALLPLACRDRLARAGPSAQSARSAWRPSGSVMFKVSQSTFYRLLSLSHLEGPYIVPTRT